MKRTLLHLNMLLVLLFLSITAVAQEKHLVQIKTYDQQLQPYRNIDISINGKDYVAMGAKGVVFSELNSNDLPPKTVKIRKEQLEAASWNYSKGILEIIVRKKNYHVFHVLVRNLADEPVANANVTYNGRKVFTATSDNQGKLDLPLPLDEKPSTSDQFIVNDHKVVNLIAAEHGNVLVVENVSSTLTDVVAQSTSPQQYSIDFDFSKLDSIQSLTVFYAVFKEYPRETLTPSERRRMDAKFHELVREIQDSERIDAASILGRISDTSIVSDDVENLVAQARLESRTLEGQRSDFDEKIKLMQEKLAAGVENLDATTRGKLVADLANLERLLVENENKFYKNQNDYRQIINSLKDKFFEFEDLENKLSTSEAQRLEEQQVFRQRLLAILSVVILFGVMIVLLIIFGNKLRKQKKELARVNEEIQSINENLESLVLNRTRLLAESNKELDTFLYRASHDLRSPICSIIGLCNIAAHIMQDESRELFEKTGQIAFAMDRLLKKLKIISEINNPSNFSRLVLLDTLVDMKSKFYDVIFNNRVKFIIECEDDLVVHSYPVLMKAILYNLIENALFYSVLKNGTAAEVKITARMLDGHLHLSVYDNGPGIDEESSSKLFEMFYKGNEHSKGNGLGLYIVQKSVQVLEGNVKVESDPGKFARFIVELPVKSELVDGEVHIIPQEAESLAVLHS